MHALFSVLLWRTCNCNLICQCVGNEAEPGRHDPAARAWRTALLAGDEDPKRLLFIHVPRAPSETADSAVRGLISKGLT